MKDNSVKNKNWDDKNKDNNDNKFKGYKERRDKHSKDNEKANNIN